MNKYCLVALIVFALSSCNSEQPEKRIYTEKDIEGYWATDRSMNPSPLKDSLGTAYAVEDEFLRLYNTCNGIGDTVYKISGDTVLYGCAEWNSDRHLFIQYLPRWIIEFVSRDRLELRDLEAGITRTYYSVFSLPVVGSDLISVEIAGCPGVLWNHDSVYSSVRQEFCRGCGLRALPIWSYGSDHSSFSRLNELYVRIDREKLLFGGRALVSQPKAIASPSPQGAIEMTSSAGRDLVWLSDCSDPCVRALYAELREQSLVAEVKWLER
jgi:hypothetical protein